MSQANLSVRVDELDKKHFENFCNQTGMNVSVAINMFIKAVLRENKLPFEITIDPFYSKENQEHLKKAIENLNSGKGVEHELIEED